MKFMKIAGLSASLVCLSAASAFAHTGDHTGMGFVAGLMHPLSGADHMLAMVSVGLWAALMGGRATWALPAAFLGAMVVGGAMGAVGLQIPAVEAGIAVSVLALGALIAFNPSVPLAAGVALTAAFAIFHGYAHGAEMPAAADGVLYGAGFVAASALLHATGIAMVVAARRKINSNVVRVAGAAVGLAGLGLLAS